jgi:SNF2 family DNA or RNA helicase
MIAMPIKATPYQHQQEAFEYAVNLFEASDNGEALSSGVFYLMDMGTGKTITSLAVSGYLYNHKKIHKLLIVAPLSIRGVWRDEFDKFADFDYTFAILEGKTERKADTLRHMTGTPLQIVVVNYESTWRLERELLAWKPDFIIADESHKVKTHNTKASKTLHKLGAIAKYKLALTGTPVTNKAIDLFSQMKFLNPAIFGNSFYSFRNRYFDMMGYGAYTPILKRNMEGELTRKLHSISFRARKQDCLDLPDCTDTVIKVSLEPSAQKLYRELVKNSYAKLGENEIMATNILTRLLRISQLTGGFLTGDDCEKPEQVSTAKLDALAELIESAYENGQKVVVMARFIAELNAIKAMLDKMKIRYSSISGETKDRSEQVRQFQEDSNVTVFVGQISTASVGLTLTAASTMIYYSLNYSMSDYEQSRARIHRVGQNNSCTYYHIVADNTTTVETISETSIQIEPPIEYKTIEPPEDGWTLELLNEVTYINGKDIDLPFCLNDLGDDFSFKEIKYYDDNTRAAAFLCYKDEEFIRIETFSYGDDLDKNDSILYMQFSTIMNNSDLSFDNFISVNGFNIYDSVNEMFSCLGKNDDYFTGCYIYNVGSNPNSILVFCTDDLTKTIGIDLRLN